MGKYIPAVIADRGGDLSKEWYIYYYYWVPDAQGNLVRKRFREYHSVNKHKTKGARRKTLQELCDARNMLLANGWSPVGNYVLDEQFAMQFGLTGNILDCIDKALKVKRSYQKPESNRFMEYWMKIFRNYLIASDLAEFPASAIKKFHITGFLRHIQEVRSVGARTRNNYLAALSALFTTMAEENMIEDNPCRYISKLRTTSEVHQPFSDEDLVKIINCLKKNDSALHLYVKFIVYPFFRPASIVHVRIRHLRLNEGLIELPGSSEKTGKPMLKRIPKEFADELRPFVEYYPPDYYLFSTEMYGKKEVVPGPVPVKKGCFSIRFKKTVKRELGFSRFQTMYGLRHTYIKMLVEAGESYDDVMKITGHRTLAAFMAYLRDHHILIPPDLSHKYRIKM